MSTTASTSTLLNPIWRLLGWLSILMAIFTTNVFAGQVSLAWNTSTGPVAGYRVYYGTSSGSYASNMNAGNTTTATVASLADGATYYFAVKAYDGNGNMSAPSNEVSTTVGSPGTGGGGLVAAYNFEETSGTTVTDVSGNGNHGTISGATRTTSGKYGKALSFDGVSHWVTVNDSSSLDLTTGMTLEAWVYPTATMSGWRTVINKEQPGGFGAAYYLAANSDLNQPELAIYTTDWRKLYGGPSLSANQWVHLAGTYDGAILRLYVNGSQVSSQPQAGGIDVTNGVLRIGGNSSWGEFFQGRIDEIRVYNRALSTSEIQTDMNTALAASSSVQYTFTTQPSGLSLSYGGVSRVTPFTVDAVIGSQQTISAPTSQQGYNFSAWSDGGVATHTITIGASAQTYTATYATATVAVPTADFGADKTSGPASLAVQFTDKSTNATAWSWNFGDGTTSAVQNPGKTYTKAGIYTVALTATNSVGSNTKTRNSYITVTEPAPVASFTVSPATTGNAPFAVTLADQSTGGITSRTWNFGDGASQTVPAAQSFVKTYSTTTLRTDYTVTLTVTGSSGSNTTTKTISAIAVKPTAGFGANATSGMAPLATTFTNTSAGTISGYAWDFGDGATSTEAYPTHTYTKAGSYTVKLTATGPAGSDTKTQTGYINVAATNGLVAAYGFEEASGTTVTDISGQGNHGTINGATRTTGKFGKALSFNGSSNWVTIPDADSLDLTTAMTLEAWVYPKNLADRRPILAKQGTTMGSPNRGYMLSAGDYSGSGKIEVEVFKSETGKSALLSSAALNTAGWQHVAFVYQYVGSGTSKMTLYINGVDKGSSTTAVGPVQKNAQPLDLGRYYWDSGYARHFNGLIDEVRIYNRALSATEIAADMNKAVAF